MKQHTESYRLKTQIQLYLREKDDARHIQYKKPWFSLGHLLIHPVNVGVGFLAKVEVHPWELVEDDSDLVLSVHSLEAEDEVSSFNIFQGIFFEELDHISASFQAVVELGDVT